MPLPMRCWPSTAFRRDRPNAVSIRQFGAGAPESRAPHRPSHPHGASNVCHTTHSHRGSSAATSARAPQRAHFNARSNGCCRPASALIDDVPDYRVHRR